MCNMTCSEKRCVSDNYWQDTLQHPAIQRTATHCNTLQHTATHCNTLQHTAMHRGVQATITGMATRLTLTISAPPCTRAGEHTLQRTACSALQHVDAHCNTFQYTATHCSTLQHHCNTLQHAATHCNTLQHSVVRVIHTHTHICM